MIPLTNRIVVVTGASAGIGQACAEAFAAAGRNSSSARGAKTGSMPLQAG